MTQIYATTIFNVLCILVLIYGTIFESKYNVGPRVRVAFLDMLIAALVVNIAEIGIIILNDNGQNYWILKTLLIVYSVGSFVTMIFFSVLLYRYISFRQEVSATAFKISNGFKILAVIFTIIACCSNYLYTFDDSIFVKGDLYTVYIMICIFVTIIDLGIIVNFGKMLGRHDVIAFSSFVFLPTFGATVGTLIWRDSNYTNALLTVSFLIMYVMIHAEQERLYSKISNQDELTGLNNRYAYEKMRSMELEYERFGVVFVDINGLKYANDNYGHSAGDELICNVAKILEQCFRKNELYRIGGDEFIAFLPGVSSEALKNRTDRLRRLLSDNILPMAAVGDVYAEGNDVAGAFTLAEQRMYVEKAAQHEKYPILNRK